MNKWQPIETAPLDETRVLLYRSEWMENMGIGYWDVADQAWYLYGGTPWHMPTHWMSLPKAPE